MKIEIGQIDGSGTRGYEIWDMDRQRRLGEFHDGQVEALIGERSMQKFYNEGEYAFNVTAKRVFEVLEVMP